MRGFLGGRGWDFELYEYLGFSLSVSLLSLRGEIWTTIFLAQSTSRIILGIFSTMGKSYRGGWAEK